MNLYLVKQKCIATISIALIMISIGLQTVDNYSKEEPYKITYEYVNTKDMAQANIKTKVETSNSDNSNVLNNLISGGLIKAKKLSSTTENKLSAVELPSIKKEEPEPAQPEVPKRIWYLPVEQGTISQNPSTWHPAYDIISPRGYNEDIYPIADGVISSIYTDSAGALIVTVLHEINGVKYTSMYVHLSRYADGLYVGKPVTVNDSLGKMGTTGYSTGVHLHIAVADCSIFDSNDTRCDTLGKFLNYLSYKAGQGDLGLGSLIWVPGTWYER